MNKIKKIVKSPRVIVLMVIVVLSIVAIHPNFWAKGAAIRSVEPNSSARDAGIISPTRGTPMSKELILAMNNVPITNVKDYYDFIATLDINRTVQIKTTKDFYNLRTRPAIEIIELNETELKTVSEIIDNKTINKTIEVNKTKTIVKGMEDIGLKVYDAPTTNIRKGLDLQGGIRILLQPERRVSQEEMSRLLQGLEQRVNVYGLSDIIIREASDLSQNQYIVVEIPGGDEEDLKLLKEQGKFEAKIGNESVFIGGKRESGKQDITYVCRSADCAGIDPNQGCSPVGEQWACMFRFAITLSPEAAQRQAGITKDLEIITDERQQYLSQQLVLYLDDKEVDALNIAAGLKGEAVTDIEISGSGFGASEQEAAFNALKNMKKLQTVLETGSLPVKLKIARTDTISPILGEEFVKNALLVGLLVIIAVEASIFVRYKRIKISIPILVTVVSELIILLGVTSIMGRDLDLASIAGIIIAIGTGVDHQIVITDETLAGGSAKIYNWKERIKNAFTIIMGTYFTVLVAMIPLLFAGAGLLKGFAITTIIGVSVGVLITRPAYAAIVEILLKE